MRKLMFAAVGLAALVSACGMANAQGGSRAPSSDQAGRGHGGFFMRADANNDGIVTRAEFDASRVTEFARLDANRDGQLSREEMRAGRHWGGGDRGRGGDRLARADANGDGNITRQEFQAGSDQMANQMFDRIDANHDGVITPAEREAARNAMHQRISERGGDRPNPDTNGDGQISRAEFDAMGAGMFQHMDANNDGRVTREEAEAAHPR
jgi:Ca2+-binding EF-hand superfamily protein